MGLYSALRACNAMVLRSSRQSRLTVATMFCSVGTMPSTAVMCCCSRVSGAGVEGTAEGAGVDGPASGAGSATAGAVGDCSCVCAGWDG